MSCSRSGPLVAWTAAWVAGRVGADDVLDAARAGDGVHVVQPSDAAAPTSLLDLLGAWRRAGGTRLVLPVPGDVRGVPGPDAFRAAALEAGEAAVGGAVGAVPTVHHNPASSAPPTVTGTTYTVDPAPPDFVQLSEAQHDLTVAIRECAAALTAAEVAGSSTAVDAELQAARRAGERLDLPPGWPPRAVALLAQAERLHAVLRLSTLDPVGGAVDRAGIGARHEALRPLIVAVRRARLAAYNCGPTDCCRSPRAGGGRSCCWRSCSSRHRSGRGTCRSTSRSTGSAATPPCTAARTTAPPRTCKSTGSPIPRSRRCCSCRWPWCRAGWR
ncbi:MAG: hypothetical protein ACTHMS_11590 [Jatrophihabitans sp.]|uniref:hypothetical protein n=1 Tax=Jatrophihabitans sp. TaxID=1932789 RepID=UPI003F8218CA